VRASPGLPRVNERTNVTRREYDQLKAVLHNAARRGPDAENRAGVPDFRAHLLGRISWVESLNPERGRKLRERFATIGWERYGRRRLRQQ
jgi:RNA-directed DNA polymerase